jgi:PBP1b-binding outer membrane lipoprotein LpoB
MKYLFIILSTLIITSCSSTKVPDSIVTERKFVALEKVDLKIEETGIITHKIDLITGDSIKEKSSILVVKSVVRAGKIKNDTVKADYDFEKNKFNIEVKPEADSLFTTIEKQTFTKENGFFQEFKDFIFWLIIFIIFLLLAGVTAYYFYIQNRKKINGNY